MQARAAEMLFRPQRISIQEDGQVMAADDETVERHAIAANFGTIGELLKQGGATLRTAELDVLHDENAPIYWERDESHDLVISLNHGQPALEALCRVLEALGRAISWARRRASRWKKPSTTTTGSGMSAWTPRPARVLNDLYQGHDVSEQRMAGMLCLFQPVVRRARGDAARSSRASRCTWRWRWTSTSA